jgi:hypothetical protein
VSGFGRVLVPVRRANPVVVAWRWRYELGAAGFSWWTGAEFGLVWTVVDWAVFAVAVWATPARHWLWVVVTPHRVRVACAHAYLHSRTGRLPMVLRTRARRHGEEVLLLLRPGLTVGDVAAAADPIAATCWAREALVEPYPGRPGVVRLVVVRR